jgi:hypothetical protein
MSKQNTYPEWATCPYSSQDLCCYTEKDPKTGIYTSSACKKLDTKSKYTPICAFPTSVGTCSTTQYQCNTDSDCPNIGQKKQTCIGGSLPNPTGGTGYCRNPGVVSKDTKDICVDQSSGVVTLAQSGDPPTCAAGQSLYKGLYTVLSSEPPSFPTNPFVTPPGAPPKGTNQKVDPTKNPNYIGNPGQSQGVLCAEQSNRSPCGILGHTVDSRMFNLTSPLDVSDADTSNLVYDFNNGGKGITSANFMSFVDMYALDQTITSELSSSIGMEEAMKSLAVDFSMSGSGTFMGFALGGQATVDATKNSENKMTYNDLKIKADMSAFTVELVEIGDTIGINPVLFNAFLGCAFGEQIRSTTIPTCVHPHHNDMYKGLNGYPDQTKSWITDIDQNVPCPDNMGPSNWGLLNVPDYTLTSPLAPSKTAWLRPRVYDPDDPNNPANSKYTGSCEDKDNNPEINCQNTLYAPVNCKQDSDCTSQQFADPRKEFSFCDTNNKTQYYAPDGSCTADWSDPNKFTGDSIPPSNANQGVLDFFSTFGTHVCTEIQFGAGFYLKETDITKDTTQSNTLKSSMCMQIGKDSSSTAACGEGCQSGQFCDTTGTKSCQDCLSCESQDPVMMPNPNVINCDGTAKNNCWPNFQCAGTTCAGNQFCKKDSTGKEIICTDCKSCDTGYTKKCRNGDQETVDNYQDAECAPGGGGGGGGGPPAGYCGTPAVQCIGNCTCIGKSSTNNGTCRPSGAAKPGTQCGGDGPPACKADSDCNPSNSQTAPCYCENGQCLKSDGYTGPCHSSKESFKHVPDHSHHPITGEVETTTEQPSVDIQKLFDHTHPNNGISVFSDTSNTSIDYDSLNHTHHPITGKAQFHGKSHIQPIPFKYHTHYPNDIIGKPVYSAPPSSHYDSTEIAFNEKLGWNVDVCTSVDTSSSSEDQSENRKVFTKVYGGSEKMRAAVETSLLLNGSSYVYNKAFQNYLNNFFSSVKANPLNISPGENQFNASTAQPIKYVYKFLPKYIYNACMDGFLMQNMWHVDDQDSTKYVQAKSEKDTTAFFWLVGQAWSADNQEWQVKENFNPDNIEDYPNCDFNGMNYIQMQRYLLQAFNNCIGYIKNASLNCGNGQVVRDAQFGVPLNFFAAEDRNYGITEYDCFSTDTDTLLDTQNPNPFFNNYNSCTLFARYQEFPNSHWTSSCVGSGGHESDTFCAKINDNHTSPTFQQDFGCRHGDLCAVFNNKQGDVVDWGNCYDHCYETGGNISTNIATGPDGRQGGWCLPASKTDEYTTQEDMPINSDQWMVLTDHRKPGKPDKNTLIDPNSLAQVPRQPGVYYKWQPSNITKIGNQYAPGPCEITQNRNSWPDTDSMSCGSKAGGWWGGQNAKNAEINCTDSDGNVICQDADMNRYKAGEAPVDQNMYSTKFSGTTSDPNCLKQGQGGKPCQPTYSNITSGNMFSSIELG